MPERLAYDEAMQFSAIRLKVQDPELRQGKVEMVKIKTARGEIERPWGMEGGFAVVYKFRKKSGKMCALRCFRVPMNPDTQFRYEHIGPYFQTHVHDITAGFQYYDAAIAVKEQGVTPDPKYPVIEMDWIEGVTLTDKLHELCRKNDRVSIKKLADQWLDIIRAMRKAHIAHGDLAGVNVMVRLNGKMVLIDYDGVYIPEFASLTQLLVGQEDFQHPQMKQRLFNERMDDFSSLVIYIALLALAIKPALWDRYANIGPDGTLQDVNILFRQEDFQDPAQSQLFQELEQLNDSLVRSLVRELKRACSLPINDVQFPFGIFDPAYKHEQALAEVENAVQADDDELIVNAWQPLLEKYPPAQRYRSRLQLAQQRVKALQLVRGAIQVGNVQKIVDSYNAALLDSCKNVTDEEKRLLTAAQNFVHAYATNDDDELVTAVETLQNMGSLVKITLTMQQQQRVTQARQRVHALQAMRVAFAHKSLEQIAAAYPAVQQSKRLTSDEKQRAQRAVAFMQAFKSQDEDALLATYDALCNPADGDFFTLTSAQEQRIRLVQKRKAALAQFRAALADRSPQLLVSTYDSVLDTSAEVTAEEREKLALARVWVTAWQVNDDEQLLAAHATLQKSTYATFFIFSSQERARIVQAQQRKAMVLAFRAALQSRNPQKIVDAYHPLLDHNTSLLPEEREQLAVARQFIQAWATNDDDAILSAVQTLQKPALSNFFAFTTQEKQRIALAEQRAHALETFLQVVNSQTCSAQQIVDAYDGSLLDASNKLTPEQKELITAARHYMAMYRVVRQGIDLDDDEIIRKAYKPELGERFTDITPAEQSRIDKVKDLQELENLLENGEYEHAANVARTTQQKTGKELSSGLQYKLRLGLMDFIRERDLTDLTISIDERPGGSYATLFWRWPQERLIQNAVFAWRTDRWPEPPTEESWNDPLWYRLWVVRNGKWEDSCTFPVGLDVPYMYLTGYTAIYDEWLPQDNQHYQQHRLYYWRFSEASEPTTSVEAQCRQTTWRI